MSNDRESENRREGFGGKHVLFAFLGGAAAGAITALLTAPSSGVELRARIRATGERGVSKARHLPEAIQAATLAAEQAFIDALEEAQPPDKKLNSAKHRHSTT